jgi:glycosyltransferase involved in cell wall biosynthesis
MRIIINALSVYSGGGLTSMINLLPALERIDKENSYVVIVSAKQVAVVKEIPERFKTHKVSFNPRNIVIRLLYEQLVLPFVLRRLRSDWLYSVGNLTTLVAPRKVLLLVENANPYSSLDVAWSTKEQLRNWTLRVLGTLSARRATVVRFLTQRSRDIICGLINIPISKTTVIPHGVTLRSERGEQAIDHPSLPERYILTVSNIGPHKNVQTLVDAFEKLVNTFGYSGSLVVAGAKVYPRYYESLKSKIKRSRLDSRVVFLDWVDPEALAVLYRRAELFVFPSAEETFGIPVVEAMGYGVPVVVPAGNQKGSRYFIPYEELTGSAAEYFNAFDCSSLCEQMHAVLTDGHRREQMVKKGKEMARRYRWDDTASALVEVFRGVSTRVSA